MKPKILVILGPTTTGKSALTVKLAKKLARTKWGGFNGAEIISADSRQVYKGLNIGTGKVTTKEMDGIPHHLLDVADPKKRFTVVEYQTLAREKIAEIFSRGNLPIICGGTGFYISASVDGVVLPEVPPNAKLRTELAKKTPDALFKMLVKLDPVRAQNIDPKNLRRVIRAIEIAKALGKVPILNNSSEYDTLKIGINLPTDKLKNNISIRLFARIGGGMIEEAKQLHSKGLSWKRMEELGLEYRYLALFLQGKMTEEEMTTKLNTEIWHYAKRQMTWFKHDKSILWFNPDDSAQIEKRLSEFLRK